MRKLASIQTISELRPIEGADRIELAIINGWQVVVQKGLHEVGNQVVYFEVDSWVPSYIDNSLSRGKDPKIFNGIKGERLKTIKLKGEISSGLVLPLSKLFDTTLVDGEEFIQLKEDISANIPNTE